MTHILHHGKNDTELRLRSGCDHDTDAASYVASVRRDLPHNECHSPFRTRVPIYAIQFLSANATGSPCPCPFAYPPIPIPMLSLPLPFTNALPAGPRTGPQGSTPFLRAVVSPVKLLSSISRSTALNNRISAGIRSPVVKLTISPGTSSFASMWSVWPSLA